MTKLVVLLCPEDGHCRNVYELDVSANSGSIYLRPVARGSRVSQTEAIDANHSAPVILKFSGIRVTYFGKGRSSDVLEQETQQNREGSNRGLAG